MNDANASIASLLRPTVARLIPYRSAQTEGDPRCSMKLDANESPWCINRGEDRDNLYPEPQPKGLISRLAEFYGTEQSRILLTRGIDEALELLIRAFCEPKLDRILIHPPTYGYYEVCAAAHDVGVLRVPLRKDFSYDLDGFRLALAEGPKIVILCNPNNPTGNLLDRSIMQSVIEETADRAIVLIDEAYIEFTEAASFTSELRRWPHLVVVRTFSKAWSLAGIRLGAILAHPQIIEALTKLSAPYPLSRPSLRVIESLLAEGGVERMRRSVEELLALKEDLEQRFKGISGIAAIAPSEANFILVQVENPRSFVQQLRSRGISVRDRSQEIPNAVRITIGDADANAALVQAIEGMGL